MNKYKDYFYYKGEHLNPYKEGSKESSFWNAECCHSDISQNNPQFIKTICDIFKRDYSEVYQSCKDTLEWEIICLFIEEAYETAGAVGDIESKLNMLKYYGSSRTS